MFHVVSAAAPVAATAGQWVWDKGNSAVNRVSYCSLLPLADNSWTCVGVLDDLLTKNVTNHAVVHTTC